MNYTALRPILWTDNLEETINFYVGILGFIPGEKNKDWGWASLYNGNVEIMLSKLNAHTSFDKPLFTGSFYFNTNDVNNLWENLKTKARICYEIDTFEWDMREFAIYDNNGYILQFGQNISEIK